MIKTLKVRNYCECSNETLIFRFFYDPPLQQAIQEFYLPQLLFRKNQQTVLDLHLHRVRCLDQPFFLDLFSKRIHGLGPAAMIDAPVSAMDSGYPCS